MDAKPAKHRNQRRVELCLKMRDVVEERRADGKNFSQLTVEQLAAGAGVSRATFYVYFEDRADFLRQAAETAVDELTRQGSLWWRAVGSGDVDALRMSLRNLIGTYRLHEGVLTAIAEMAVAEPRVAEHYRHLMHGAIGALSSALRHGADTGATRSIGVLTPAALVWMVERACGQLLGLTEHGQEEELVDVLADVIAAVVYAQAEHRPRRHEPARSPHSGPPSFRSP